MFNWSTNTTQLKKSPREYKKWKLEQLINFGLGKEKLKRSDLVTFLPMLYIDPAKRRYLQFLLSR